VELRCAGIVRCGGLGSKLENGTAEVLRHFQVLNFQQYLQRTDRTGYSHASRLKGLLSPIFLRIAHPEPILQIAMAEVGLALSILPLALKTLEYNATNYRRAKALLRWNPEFTEFVDELQGVYTIYYDTCFRFLKPIMGEEQATRLIKGKVRDTSTIQQYMQTAIGEARSKSIVNQIMAFNSVTTKLAKDLGLDDHMEVRLHSKCTSYCMDTFGKDI
jgi:hypothetical protein